MVTLRNQVDDVDANAESENSFWGNAAAFLYFVILCSPCFS